tara:strand:- start:4514 stop:5446 length:933 start_codon:yes stop_codon:yes gene_type:complete
MPSGAPSPTPYDYASRSLDWAVVPMPLATYGINVGVGYALGAGALMTPLGWSLLALSGGAAAANTGVLTYRAYYGESGLGAGQYQQLGIYSGILNSVQQNGFRQIRTNIGFGSWSSSAITAAASILIPNISARITSNMMPQRNWSDAGTGMRIDAAFDLAITAADFVGDAIGSSLSGTHHVMMRDRVNLAYEFAGNRYTSIPAMATYGGTVGSGFDSYGLNGVIISPAKSMARAHFGLSDLGMTPSAVNGGIGELSFQGPIIVTAAIGKAMGINADSNLVLQGVIGTRRFQGVVLNGALSANGYTRVLGD